MSKSTNAYAAKRAFIDLLTANTGTGQSLDGVQIQYARNDKLMQRVCVYGGGVRFSQNEASGEGQRLVVFEQVTLGLYVRVLDAAGDIRVTDQAAEAIGDAIAALMAANPHPVGTYSWVGIIAGQGDYAPNDDSAVTNIGFQVQVEGYLT